ncbi:MAG: DUF2087 domain-containing protein [bacterium]|nr:DUF2087 domain-containing protein [bacterium]
MDDALQPYLDEAGRITSWPNKKRRQDRIPILNYLAARFELGRIYTEREVNEVLKAHHTFEDWALLRRELIEQGYMQRSTDGHRYWLTGQVGSVNVDYRQEEY